MSMKSKQEGIKVQAEQRKQEGIGILRQAQSLEQSKLLSLRLTYGDATQSEVTSHRLPKIANMIIGTQQNIAERDQIIGRWEEINPTGNISSSYLVELESMLGTGQQMKSKSEHERDTVEQLAVEVQNMLSKAKA